MKQACWIRPGWEEDLEGGDSVLGEEPAVSFHGDLTVQIVVGGQGHRAS